MQDSGSQANFDYMRLLDVPQVDGIHSIPLNDFVGMKGWINDSIQDTWRKNYIANRNKIVVTKQSSEARKKCCILVGSSPAIKPQIKTLKNINENFIIISSNGAYPWLMQNGVEPDYVMLIEGRDHVVGDVSLKSNAKLIVSQFVDPKIYDIWNGPIETFVCSATGMEDLIKEDGLEVDVAGGNVLNASFLWSYKYLGCRNYITIGNSLCYYDDYYVDGRSTDHVMKNLKDHEHIKAVDMQGNVVSTTAPLLLYKTWLETYSRISGADFINATEDGIFGVYPEPVEKTEDNIKFRVKYLPWISIAPLSLAIEAYNNKLEDLK